MEMLPIVDNPTIQYIIEDILNITGKSKRANEDHFDRSCVLEYEFTKKNNTEMLALVQSVSELVGIHYIWQKDQKGLGHEI